MYTRTAEGELTDGETVLPLVLSENDGMANRPAGFLRHDVVLAIGIYEEQNSQNEFPFGFWTSQKGGAILTLKTDVAHHQDALTAAMNNVVQSWRKDEFFKDLLGKPSDEQYPIYRHAQADPSAEPIAFTIERPALPLFGFPNFGSFLIAYVHTPDGNTKIWVPHRSKTKRTWPGYLDVTVGGGMSAGSTPLATILRESEEEASLSPSYVNSNIRPAGVLPFLNRSPTGWILPGLYYLFDLPLPSSGSVVPQPNAADGEVEEFELMDVEQVLDCLVRGEFKPSSGLAMIDWMIRHGYLTEDSDARFAEVCRELRRDDIGLSVPWWTR